MLKFKKVATFLLVGTLAALGRVTMVQAEEMPMAGIAVVLDDFYVNAENSDETAVKKLMEEISIQNNLAFAQVDNYVNIRSKASEEGKIIGKLYDNAAATILGEKNGWYKIKSGSVTGYINGDYLVTGEKAVSIAKKVGNKVAVVDTTTLKVRKKASTDSTVLTLIAIGDDLKVTKELEGWAKVQVDENTYGYVSTDYVKLQTTYEEAISIEEERQRLAEEQASSQAENQSQAQSQSSNSSSNGSSSTTKGSSSSSSSSSSSGSSSNYSSSGNSIADYAVQFVGNPYVWGGTSLTNGADCSGFTQSVFRKFGISIPRTSRSQATSGTRVSLDNLRAGDLVFYSRGGTINHVAIYIGGGQVISASSPSTGIRITSYNYRTPVKAVRYN
ncbi:SH3 domain-containing C40 family peptidase [Anaerocolumna sp. AGMB13020]|uniref:C40 family peptidase n=1 Tax=Anaerocolumna sp. AGMB13020 TaxID=3081750 RepID=UPI002953DD6C|nr:SH3 domain-containing C40 family peptidase [Anaerocolumna sp. AGMB13020]WOO35830.1 SH3 domain-containing C40 family peptidase [Anaerocolumna sp. AGMB13020]